MHLPVIGFANPFFSPPGADGRVAPLRRRVGRITIKCQLIFRDANEVGARCEAKVLHTLLMFPLPFG